MADDGLTDDLVHNVFPQLRRDRVIRIDWDTPPEYDDRLKVDRATRFGNPFHLYEFNGDRSACLARYVRWMAGEGQSRIGKFDRRYVRAALPLLQGKALACHCAPKLCHGHVLAAAASADDVDAELDRIVRLLEETDEGDPPDELPAKALTLIAPWGQSIVHGDKRIENRGWLPHEDVRGELVGLHCGKKTNPNAVRALRQDGLHDFDDDLHFPGTIIGAARVIGVVNDYLADWYVDEHPGDDRVDELRASPWFTGEYGWVLDDVVAYQPVPARGMPGLWKIDDSVQQQIRYWT